MEVTELAEILTVRGKTVSVAEADTCGLVGYMLGTVPGASKYFPGGVIAYSGGLKERILGIPDELSKTYGTVSEEMAIAMAKGGAGADRNRLRRCRLRESPAPVPGSRNTPIGTFFLGLSVKDGVDQAVQVRLNGDRDAIKRAVAQEALDLLGRHLTGG